jgi:hypothetical protein
LPLAAAFLQRKSYTPTTQVPGEILLKQPDIRLELLYQPRLEFRRKRYPSHLLGIEFDKKVQRNKPRALSAMAI